MVDQRHDSNEDDDLDSAEAEHGFGAGLIELVTGIKNFADTLPASNTQSNSNKVTLQNLENTLLKAKVKQSDFDNNLADTQHVQLQLQNKNKQDARKMHILKTQERLKKLAKRVMQPLKIVNKLIANDVAINNLADGHVANEHVAKNTIKPTVGMSGIGFLALGSLTLCMIKDVNDLRWLLNEINKMRTLLKRKKFEEDMQLYYEQTEKMTTFVLQMYKEYFDKLIDELLQQKREVEAKVLQMLVAVSTAINIIQDIQATLADYKNFLADSLKAFENSELSDEVKKIAIAAIKVEQEFEEKASGIVDGIEDELHELADDLKGIKDSVAAAITEVMPTAIINGQQTEHTDVQSPSAKVNVLQQAVSEELLLELDSITANLQKQSNDLKQMTERKKELITLMDVALRKNDNIAVEKYAIMLLNLQDENMGLLKDFEESKLAVAMLKGKIAAVKSASIEEVSKLGMDDKLVVADEIVQQISTLEETEFAVEPAVGSFYGDLGGDYSSKGEYKSHAIGNVDIKANDDVDCGAHEISCLSESKGESNANAGSDDEAKASVVAAISEFVDNAEIGFLGKLSEGSISAEDEEIIEKKTAELRDCLIKLMSTGDKEMIFSEEYRDVLREANDLCALIGGKLAIDIPLIESQNIGSKFMVIAEQYMETNAGLVDGSAFNSKGVIFSKTNETALTCSDMAVASMSQSIVVDNKQNPQNTNNTSCKY